MIDPDADRAARLRHRCESQGREVLSLALRPRPPPSVTAAWDRARAGACVVVGGRTAVWAPVPDLARGRRARRGRRSARRGAGAHLERARRRVRARAPRRRDASAWSRRRPTVDVLVALDEQPDPDDPRAAGRGSRSSTRATSSPVTALLTSRARRRAAPRPRRRWAIGLRAEPQGSGAPARVPDVRRAARCERCGATVRARTTPGLACSRCGTARPPICLHCHGTTFRAVRPGVSTRPRRPRGAAPAGDGRRGRRRDATRCPTPTCSSAPKRCCTACRPAVRWAWSRSSSSTRSCSRPGHAPPSRRSGCSSAAARLLGPRAANGVLLLQTRLPEHEVVAGGAPRRAARRRRRRTRPSPGARAPAVRRGGRAQRRRRRGRRRVRRAARRRRGHRARTGRRRQARARPCRDRRRPLRRARARPRWRRRTGSVGCASTSTPAACSLRPCRSAG